MPSAALRILLPLSLALAAPLTANAQISDEVVKIGVLTDLSGPASSPTGPGSVAAAQMAVDDFGGKVAGKPVVVISADHQIKPDVGAAIARRWYDVEQVDLIVDVPVSAVGLAVQNVAKDKKKMLIVHSTGTADFHGKFCSPTTLQWVFDTRALAVGTAQEVVKRGGDTWFFLTADYAFGHSLEQQASEVIRANGGKVLGAVRHPFATPDLSSFILQAQASKAKIIGIASGPPDNTNAVKLAGEFGIFQGGQQLAGLLVLITDVHGARAQGSAGPHPHHLLLLGHGREDARMVQTIFCQAKCHAHDVAGRRLLRGHELPAGHRQDRHGRAAEGRRADARLADRGLLLAQRQAAQRRAHGARSGARAGEEAGGVALSLGLLSGARAHSRRAGVRPSGSRVQLAKN